MNCWNGYAAIAQALLNLELTTERPLVILSGNSIPHGLMALAAQYVGIPSAALAPAYSLASKDHAKLHDINRQITPGAIFADDLDRFAPAMDAAFPGLPRLGCLGRRCRLGGPSCHETDSGGG